MINLKTLAGIFLLIYCFAPSVRAKDRKGSLPHLIIVSPVLQKKIIVQILDEFGRPIAARIRVSEQDSIYYAPVGHRVDLKLSEGGGDVILDYNR